MSKNNTCGISPVFCTVCTVGTRLQKEIQSTTCTTRTSYTWSEHCNCGHHSLLLSQPKAPVIGRNGHVNDCVQEMDTQSPRRRRGSPRSIVVLISSPRGWARLGEQFRPRVRAQLRTFFRTGKSAKNPCKILICIVTQTTG